MPSRMNAMTMMNKRRRVERSRYVVPDSCPKPLLLSPELDHTKMHQRRSDPNTSSVMMMGTTTKAHDVSGRLPPRMPVAVVEPHESEASTSSSSSDETFTTASTSPRNDSHQPKAAAAAADGKKEQQKQDDNGKNNTLPEILMVRLQSDDPTEVAFALKALAESMKEADDHQQQPDPNQPNEILENAYRMGAHTLVVLAMRKFINREDVQTFGCLSLQMLAFPKSQRATVANLAGGVVAIVMAMDTYPESLWVQHAGMAALTNIFDQLDNEQDESSPSPMPSLAPSSSLMEVARHFVFGFDGIDVIVRALKKFPEQRHVQLCCCAILYNLATKECFRSSLRESEAMGALGVAYERWFADSDPTISTCVSNALKLLIMN